MTLFIIQHNCIKSEIGGKETEGGRGRGVREDRGYEVVSVAGHSAQAALGRSGGLCTPNNGKVSSEMLWKLTQETQGE